MKVKILKAAPKVGELIRTVARARDVVYGTGTEFEFELMVLSPARDMNGTSEINIETADVDDFQLDMTDGQRALISNEFTSYLVPARSLIAWRCVKASPDCVLGVQTEQ